MPRIPELVGTGTKSKENLSAPEHVQSLKSHCWHLFGHIPKLSCYFYSKSCTLPQNMSLNSNLKPIHFERNLFCLKIARPLVKHGLLQVLGKVCVYVCVSPSPLPGQWGIDMKLKQTTSIFFWERFMTTVYRISSCELNCKTKCFKIICLKQSSVMYN